MAIFMSSVIVFDRLEDKIDLATPDPRLTENLMG